MSAARIAAAALLLGTAVAAQTPTTWIAIRANGVERGAFAPRAAPYTQGGPSVSVYLFDRRDVRAPDGKIITGFEFIGWSEGENSRVQVFTLVPRDDAPNEYLANGNRELLSRRDLASYQIAQGQTVRIAEMTRLGIEPMVLSSERRD
jgi:hypothetical protein